MWQYSTVNLKFNSHLCSISICWRVSRFLLRTHDPWILCGIPKVQWIRIRWEMPKRCARWSARMFGETTSNPLKVTWSCLIYFCSSESSPFLNNIIAHGISTQYDGIGPHEVNKESLRNSSTYYSKYNYSLIENGAQLYVYVRLNRLMN